MTRWKRNRLLKAEKMAVEKADRESNKTSYIGNVFKKIRNKIAEIISKFRK
jgi:hypothetical protein